MDKAPGRIQINAGIYKGTVLKVPDAVVRPTPLMVRQALFNSLQTTLSGATFLDLFAGSGAMGLEALSRGAGSCVLVESGRQEVSALRQSLDKMGLSGKHEAQLLAMDINRALALLTKDSRRFDYIFIDPPYEQWNQGAKLPWLTALAALLTPTGQIICQRDKVQAAVGIPGLTMVNTRIYGRSALDFYKLNNEGSND